MSGHSIKVVLMLLIFMTTIYGQVGYKVTHIDTGDFVSLFDINDLGEVAGQFSTEEIEGTRAFYYSDGKIIRLGDFGGEESSRATGINNSSVICGYASVAAGGTRPFFFEEGRLWEIMPYETQGNLDISNAGHIIGTRFSTGFIFKQGNFENLKVENFYPYAVNDSGLIIGRYSSDCAIYEEDTLRTLPIPEEWNNCYPHDVNNKGQIVGRVSVTNQTRAFLFDNGIFTDLGSLDNTSSEANGINENGIVVGNTRRNGQIVAFIYVDGSMYDLNDLAEPIEGKFYTDAKAINNYGQICVNALISGIPIDQDGAILTPDSSMVPVDHPEIIPRKYKTIGQYKVNGRRVSTPPGVRKVVRATREDLLGSGVHIPSQMGYKQVI